MAMDKRKRKFNRWRATLEYIHHVPEFFYDEKGRRRFVGPSFWLDNCFWDECIACPICRACIHEAFIDEEFKLICRKYENPPQLTWEGSLFQCDGYEPNKESRDYELVQKLLKRDDEARKLEEISYKIHSKYRKEKENRL
jgi:hypothetical protein